MFSNKLNILCHGKGWCCGTHKLWHKQITNSICWRNIQVLESFVLGDGTKFGEHLKHRSERANSTPMWGRQISAVAGLQNCNRVVCSRTKMIHYIWSSKQLCRQFVNEFIWIFRFSLAPVYVIWFAHEALLAYFPSSCYVYLFHTVLTVVLF